MDLDNLITIICLVVAVVVFFQLHSVLGKRTGNEKPPFDPYSAQKDEKDDQQTVDKVVSLPNSEKRARDDFSDINAIAEQNTALNDGLRAIRKVDAAFAPQSFSDGAQAAYEMIVTAFAKEDLKTLEPLLAPDVFAGFAAAVEERQRDKQTVDFTFVGINKAEFANAYMEASQAFITMRLTCEMISATYDDNKALIDGDPQTIIEITDFWTFSRDTQSDDPNWKLVATQDHG